MSVQKKQNRVFIVGFVLIAVVILWALARPFARKLSQKTGMSEEKINEEIAKAPFIAPGDLFEKIKNGENLFIVDLRTSSDFSEGHIAASINVPIDDFNSSFSMKNNVEKTADIVLLNQGENIFEVAKKTNEVVSSGYPNAKYLEGGISSWQEQGYPVVSSGGLEVDRNKIKTISVEELKDDLLGGREMQFIDTRNKEEFSTGHIPGALNIQLSEIEKRAKEISSFKKVVIYGKEDEGETAAISLFDLNFFNVYILSGGLDAWKAVGGKIE